MSVSDLRRREAPLELSPAEFREAGHRLVDAIADFLGSMPRGPVNRDETPTALRRLLPDGGLPEDGRSAASLVEETLPLLCDHSLFNGHPRFFGYITSSAAPIGALADLLAATINPNVGGWQLSPVASEIEGQTVRWIAELVGMPQGTGGLLTSGGNMANFLAFLAARRARTTEESQHRGVAYGGGRLQVYASAATHTWIHKATDLFGHGTDSIRSIPCNADERANLDGLERQLDEDVAAGHRPFLLVGNGGTVSTGAVDPLPQMAEIARRRGLWFHVDGAYGGVAGVAPEAPADLAGIAQADSVAVDPHKWLYAALEAGCVLVRDPASLRAAFGYTPAYYRFTGEEDDPRVNYYELGLQNSRGFRALKVWWGLRQAGRAGYARMISQDIRLAQALHARVAAEPELEARTLGLSIATFRYVPPDLKPGGEKVDAYLDRLNEALLARLKASGELFLSNAVLDGSFLLRACVVNFRTTLDDIEAIPGIVVRLGREVDRELRAAAGCEAQFPDP